MDNALDLICDLIRAHKDMRIVLRKAADTEQAVKCAAELVPVHNAQLTDPQGQLPIAVGLRTVYHDTAGAVHGLDAVILPIDLGGIHIVLIVIPVAGGLPQVAVHDQRGRNLYIAVPGVNLTPVIDQCVFQRHALGQEEGEAGAFIAEHEQAHFLAKTAVIPLFSLFHELQMLIQLCLVRKAMPLIRVSILLFLSFFQYAPDCWVILKAFRVLV